MEIAVHHNHYESHHASGPQDNAGKDPRKAMDRAILHKKSETIYDYHRYVTSPFGRACVTFLVTWRSEQVHGMDDGTHGDAGRWPHARRHLGL